MIRATTVIILVNYNGCHDTKECIHSIKASNGSLPFIILVDNNSSNSKELDNLKKDYKKLHIIYNNQNEGFGVANNIGIKWAQEYIDFEYLLLLNNDTLIEPNSIKELIKPFSMNTAIGITTAKTFFEGNKNIIWYGGGEIDYNRGWPKITDFNNMPSLNGANKSKFVSFASGCTMMFSKTSISKIEGFDNNFFMYFEDFELCIRALKLGFKIYYCSESIVYHKVQGSVTNDTNNNKLLNVSNPNLEFLYYNLKTNQYRAMKKHHPSFKFFSFYWFEFIFKILFYILKGRHSMLKVAYKIILENFKKETKFNYVG